MKYTDKLGLPIWNEPETDVFDIEEFNKGNQAIDDMVVNILNQIKGGSGGDIDFSGTGLTEEQANNIKKIPSIEGIVTSNSQAIANKANKSEVRMKNTNITLNDCDSDMLTAIQGGDGTNFELLSIPRDNSINIKMFDAKIYGRKFIISNSARAYASDNIFKLKEPITVADGVITIKFKYTPNVDSIGFQKILSDTHQSNGYTIPKNTFFKDITTNIEANFIVKSTLNEIRFSHSSSLLTGYDGLYEDVIITHNGIPVDFEASTTLINGSNIKIQEITNSYDNIATKGYVEDAISKKGYLTNESFNNSLLEDRWRVNKTSKFLNFTLEFIPIKLQSDEMVSLEFSIENYENINTFFTRINYDGTNRAFSVPKTINSGTLTHLRKIPSIQFHKGETIYGLSFGCDTSNIRTINAIFSGIRIKVGEKYYYPYKVKNSTPEEVYKIQRNIEFLVTKDMLDKNIPKQNFTLPFVNNLYVVQGSKRKNSVPIFIDYLYDGNNNKILFENGEDRTYIREAVSSPNTQSKNIINTKETLKFKSPTLEVAPITFNKISIEEKTPNGKIRLLIIGDSVTAGAITEKQYWAVARELFALEDIDRKRNSDVMFLGSNNVRNTTINYSGVEKQVKSCACGISSWSLTNWLTSSSSHFVYDKDGTPTFSILKWLERYRTHLDDGTKLKIGDSRLGTEITSSNIDNIQCCTPNIVYINSTHNGGTIEQHEQMIEIIQREIPGCKIIVGNPMPLTGTWHKEKYVGKEWLDDVNITGPNYSWGGNYATSRMTSLNYYTQRERENTDNTFYFMPQVVTMPTVESLEYDLVDCGVKMMKQPSKVNQLPKEHPGTLTHKIWGYELYALLKYISGIEQGVTNNFDAVPLFD